MLERLQRNRREFKIIKEGLSLLAKWEDDKEKYNASRDAYSVGIVVLSSLIAGKSSIEEAIAFVEDYLEDSGEYGFEEKKRVINETIIPMLQSFL